MFLCQNLVSSSNWIYLFMMSAKGLSFSFMIWCKDSAKCTIIYQTLRYIKLGTYIFCRLALKLDLLNVSGVNWIGLYTKYLTERAQRKAFLETRRSLEMRFKTQKENERQERCRPCPFIQILSRFYPDFTQILSRFYPNFILIELG